MPTRENKIGLVLAFLLGLSDIAFLATLSGDSGDKPPVWIVVVSVVVGLATLVLVTPPPGDRGRCRSAVVGSTNRRWNGVRWV